MVSYTHMQSLTGALDMETSVSKGNVSERTNGISITNAQTLDVRVSASPPDALFTLALNHRTGVSHPCRFCSAGQSKPELQVQCF